MNGNLIVTLVFIALAICLAVAAKAAGHSRPVAARAWRRTSLLLGLCGAINAALYFRDSLQ